MAGAAASDGAHPGHGVPPRPWTWLDQQHGAEVVVARSPGDAAGAAADAAVTAAPGAVLVVRTADCAPVALLAEGAVGIAHAGWRGLLEGVVPRTVEAMRALGAGDLEAHVGPCIGPGHYEFGADELDAVAHRFGDRVRARTAAGRPALHLAEGVVAALEEAGVARIARDGRCTAADEHNWFSHRARGDVGRQGSFVWLDADGRPPAAPRLP